MDFNNEKNTVLQLSTEYGRYTSELPPDADVESLLDMFVGLMVSATFSYKGVLEAMREFAEEKLEVYFPQEIEPYDEEEDDAEIENDKQFTEISNAMKKLMEEADKTNDPAIKLYFKNALTEAFETGKKIDTAID